MWNFISFPQKCRKEKYILGFILNGVSAFVILNIINSLDFIPQDHFDGIILFPPVSRVSICQESVNSTMKNAL